MNSSAKEPAHANLRSDFAYLIPAFPGQTHAFFWRERKALKSFGVDASLLSTRRPDAAVRATHDWAEEAEHSTQYLLPLTVAAIGAAMLEWLRAGPRGWGRLLAAFFRSRTDGLRDRLRLTAAFFLGVQLASLCRRRGLRHVHVHSCGNSLNIALAANRLSGLSYSMTLHGPLETYGSNQREKWRHAAFAILITQTLCEMVEKKLAGYLPPILEIAPMGVDTDLFQRSSPYQFWNGTDTLRIFCCGRLNPCKRHDVLIRAIHELNQKGIRAELTIAGGDDTPDHIVENELKRISADLKITDQVFLPGKQSEQQIRDRLETCHVFALASDSEALGVALMEALSMEVPVIGTAVGGVHELLRDAGCPQVPAGDAAAMAGGILDACKKAAEKPDFLPAARQLIENRFSSSRSAEALSRLTKRSGFRRLDHVEKSNSGSDPAPSSTAR